MIILSSRRLQAGRSWSAPSAPLSCTWVEPVNELLRKRSSYLRASWGTAVQVSPQLWRLRLDNPRGHLLVNTYVFFEPGTLAIIDPGWPWSLDALKTSLKALGLAQSLREVTHWLYTHTHVDHMGAAALLSQESQAPQLAWEAISPQLARWHSFQDELADWSWWVRQAFVEPGRSELLALSKTERPSGRRVSLVEEHGELAVEHFSPLKLGQRFEVGSLELEVIDARGHDPFHVAFWEKTRGWLFSGDVVLPVPTPLSPPMHDDLALYEGSLARLSALPVSMLLPGHGAHVQASRLAESFDRSRGFITQLQHAILTTIERHDDAIDLYTLALKTSGDGQPMQPLSRWWVHLALLDTHVQRLVERGELVKTVGAHPDSGPLYWL